MNFRIEDMQQPIAVVRPVYTASGDSCEIITDSGESYYDRRSIRSVRRAMARTRAVDLSAQGTMVTKMLGRRGVLPFYLDNARVYVPFKMRRSITPNDYCYGYVRLDQVVDLELQDSMPVLRLNNGLGLTISSSPISARQNLEMGRRLARMLKPHPDEEEQLMQAIMVVLAWLKK